MIVSPVKLDLCLGEDRMIDIFILQWHTPEPFRNHTWAKMASQDVDKRRQVLGTFQEWLRNDFDGNQSSRPLFIVAPELSVPACHVNLLDQLVEQVNRPTVIVAGLEYLTAEEYLAIRQGLLSMNELENWQENVPGDSVVNAAAIWIHEGSNTDIRKYIQPKRYPCDEETRYVYPGSNCLVFKSSDQTPGCRLNFCVQICSDFNSEQNVKHLRQELAEHLTSVLDLTFLLQCNKNQEATQLKGAIKAYFEPPDRMVQTSEGCLVCVNNASPNIGKTTIWGQSKFCFHYKREWRQLKSPPTTFWLKDERNFDHQAAIFRESVPGIYWITYMPHYLLGRIAGSGTPLPFFKREFCYDETYNSDSGNDNDRMLFASIQPSCHWLKTEWKKGGHELRSENEGEHRSIARDVASVHIDSYEKGTTVWSSSIQDNERTARNVLNTMFLCWDDEKRHPFFPLTEMEPQNWGSIVSDGVKRMMQVYALLQLGLEATPNTSIMPAPNGLHHAAINNSSPVTLMYGGAIQSPSAMLIKYLHEATTTNFVSDLISGSVSKEHWLVMLAPKGTPDKTRLLNNISPYNRGEPQHNADAHLQPPGDVVTIQPPKPTLIYDVELFGKLEVAKDSSSLKSELAQAIGVVA